MAHEAWMTRSKPPARVESAFGLSRPGEGPNDCVDHNETWAQAEASAHNFGSSISQ